MAKRLGVVLRCPYCGVEVDRYDQVGGERGGPPGPGSLSFCPYCGGAAVFRAGMVGLVLQEPTEAEQLELEQDPVVRELRAAWQQLHPLEQPRG